MRQSNVCDGATFKWMIAKETGLFRKEEKGEDGIGRQNKRETGRRRRKKKEKSEDILRETEKD